jgi:phosphoglycolate phosphatase
VREIDLMIFDFDGTLVDTVVDLTAAVNYTLRHLGREEKREEEIAAFVGDGVTKLIERSLGEDDPDYYSEAINIFAVYYSDHLLDNTHLYPGVKDVLDFYWQKKKVILTNKRYSFTMDIVQGLNIEKYFLEIVGEGSLPYGKPDKRLVDYLLHKYSVKKERSVIVGDGMNDVNLAKNSGIVSCIYLNGLGKRQDLLTADADYYCENLSDIKGLFY